MKAKGLTRFLAIATATAALTGCSTSGCLENQSAIPLAGFYASDTGEAVAISGLRIGGVGAPGDSLILADKSSVQQVYLPMRSTANTVEWRIEYTQPAADGAETAAPAAAVSDIVAFDYTSKPVFASEECGAMYFYTIKAVRHSSNMIDSIAVTDSLVTNTDIERIKIFFRVDRSEEEQEPASAPQI